MKDFLDRQPTKAGRRKLTFEDGEVKYATVEMADDPTEEGTPLNRDTMMAVQGFYNFEVSFEKGKIVETNQHGDTLETTFPKGSIALETFTSAATGHTIKQRTYKDGKKIRGEFIT